MADGTGICLSAIAAYGDAHGRREPVLDQGASPAH